MLSQIARPGSLKLRDGVSWVNGERTGNTIPSPVNLRESFEYHVEKIYPVVEFFPFVPFYHWLRKNDLIFNDEPKNVYQKAINNLSYISGHHNRTTQLIYQMMTLEQMYTDTNAGIAEQLDKKIQVFLGPMNTHKKQIKKMYDIRSRFLHGDLPLKASHRDDIEDLPGFEYEIADACDLSALIIISTLQKMYKEDRVDLDFEWRLRE